MAATFPTSLDTFTSIPSGTKQGTAIGSRVHREFHNDQGDAIEALEAKIGTGASTPTASTVLAGTGTGTSAWTNSPTIAGNVTVGGLTSAGLLTAAGVTLSGNTAITPAAVSGTPAQHGLYRDNIIKGWVRATVSAGTPSIAGSFNVSGITDTATGQLTVSWDRDFASTAYASLATGLSASLNAFCEQVSQVVGSALFNYLQVSPLALVDPDAWHILAIGPQ